MPTLAPAPPPKRTPIRRWSKHLWKESTRESLRPLLPAAARPDPASWSNDTLTAAWLGHATVLLNFHGLWIITDPVLFPRCGIRLPGWTLGPKRLTAAALHVRELPPIDLVLLSHAHFDHLDTRTLHRLPGRPAAVTAKHTADLLRRMPFSTTTELRWNDEVEVQREAGAVHVRAFPVRHWGARLRHDFHRGYNGYVLERNGHRLICGGDTAMTDSFAALRTRQPFDLAIMPIGAYDPWIGSHATPEQAVAMANAARADHILPVHHQTFRLSAEPFREPIERFEAALDHEPERIALREIGETFTLGR
ncbi:MAG: MBL fold metallo-hydrolase [Chthoniobacterales bacterium]|nr:MBL fold metallo-hydrolase [Chthoniobacterales bacterium]